MPFKDPQDARDVEEHIGRIFAASDPDRAQAIRALFVEKLDFNGDSDQVDFAAAPAGVKLPKTAERIAELDGVHVLYVVVDIPETTRVRKAEAVAAAKEIEASLGEDMLLVFTNTSRSQLHFIHPDFGGTQLTLRRMVVERDLPRRTAVQQFSNVYWSYERSGRIREALQEAFDVEPVTRKFFQDYKRVFEAAEALVSGFGPSEDEKKRLFVQTLFNRLMFVYFLSRKGWLTFNGDNDYLKALWTDYRTDIPSPLTGEGRGDHNFYRDRLCHLFFFGLNNPRSSDMNSNFKGRYMESVFGQVPFLNGGLFEKTHLDEQDGVIVPDDAIRPVLTDLFEKFNFTVMESTPFDIEVAVDPEMLGKVFEELVTGRHQSGSYYTPRPVVSFMCREALKGYLEGQGLGASPEAIQEFVDDHKIEGISDQAHGVREALAEIRVVDPACGSGAYLLGMMQEMVDLRTSLDTPELRQNPRYIYDLKLHSIGHNLYGVDNDEFAINIAMLRMWLSLIVDYEGAVPEPLPNLDFKVLRGDSLLGPDPSTTAAPNPDPTSPLRQTELFDYQIAASSLGALKAEYMRKKPGPTKISLRERIKNTEQDLRDALGGVGAPQGSVDWRIAFAEVFAARGGFDVVIANPPYVRHEQFGELKPDLATRFPSVYQGKADILVYFFARAIELMRPGGWLAFITSNKYMRADYGKKLRALLRDSLTIEQVMDFGDLPVFTATSYPAVLIGRNGQAEHRHELRVADLTTPVRIALNERGLSVTPDTVNKAMDGLPALLDRHGHADYPQAFLRQNGWALEDPALIRLFERLMNQGTPLGEFVDGSLYMGVKTGLNRAFVIDRYKRDELVDADPRSAEIIKPYLRGKNIKRWSAEWAGLYIIFTNRGVDIDRYPRVREHLEIYRLNLERRATSHLHPWYELQQPQEGIYEEFARPKIVWPDIAREVRFAFDTKANYLDMTCFTIPTDSRWLMALLNSHLSEFLLCQITSSLRGGFLRPKRQYMTRLPIVTPDPVLQRRLDSIASAGIAGEPVDTDQLNEIVNHLYDLSPADIALINDWFQRRSLTTPQPKAPRTISNR
ncbi:MAG: Eco57I restriction-modification methylase domain-containing protein [Chloroflexi bacterium]|nr:Eco57I restriction-modification methylase domain-containing protein [Chloroflexota bacterium]MCY3936763.1 Eco57I restriction-modification methylase domain-containing protein [Chloroflexota bacterium]